MTSRSVPVVLAIAMFLAPFVAEASSSHCYNIKAQDLKSQCLAGARK